MPILKLTDSAIEKLKPPVKGTVWYSDPELRGFQLAVGKLTKTFYVLKSAGGRNVRVLLGKHPFVKARAARELALKAMGEISKGNDPRRRKTSTLRSVLDDYINVYSHASHARLSASTAEQYRKALQKHCSKWLDRDLKDISKADVSKFHRDIRSKPYMANQCLRVLRMVFKHAIGTLGYELIDPTGGVKPYREEARETKIDDWAAWFEEVARLPNVRKGYYLLAALTGIRRSNLAELRWEQIDLKAKAVKLYKIKNGSSPILPLSDYAGDVLASLKGLDATWVFPANSKSGHLVEPKDDVRGRVHDLRRMFTTAAAKCYLPEYVIARLRGDIGKQTTVQGYMDDIGDHNAVNKIAAHLLMAWKAP